jgi:hypothetical protein
VLRQLDKATVGRFQLSTDALGTYRMNVPFVLGSRVAFGQMIKVYASTQETTRYSPAKIISAERRSVFGPVDTDCIGTSRIERLNGTVRQSLRRFTRLTFGHSKSLKHHVAMQAIFFAWYNLCRPHMALDKKTPAMASGLTGKVWSVRELLERAAKACKSMSFQDYARRRSYTWRIYISGFSMGALVAGALVKYLAVSSDNLILCALVATAITGLLPGFMREKPSASHTS